MTVSSLPVLGTELKISQEKSPLFVTEGQEVIPYQQPLPSQVLGCIHNSRGSTEITLVSVTP